MWRTDRDSNPGYLAVYTLSKRAPSATRPSVREFAKANLSTLPYGSHQPQCGATAPSALGVDRKVRCD